MQTHIERTLEAKLKAFANLNGYVVAWPGVCFDETSQLYIRVYHLPSEPGIGGSAEDSFMDYSGIMQLSVIFKKDGKGQGAAADLAAAIISEFKKATVIDDFKIMKSWKSPVIEFSQSHLSIPVSVQYRALA